MTRRQLVLACRGEPYKTADEPAHAAVVLTAVLERIGLAIDALDAGPRWYELPHVADREREIADLLRPALAALVDLEGLR